MCLSMEAEGGGEMRAMLSKAMEPLLEIAARCRRVAPGEQQRRKRQRLFGFGFGRDPGTELGQQLLCLLQATLAYPQGGQPDQCLGM